MKNLNQIAQQMLILIGTLLVNIPIYFTKCIPIETIYKPRLTWVYAEQAIQFFFSRLQQCNLPWTDWILLI